MVWYGIVRIYIIKLYIAVNCVMERERDNKSGKCHIIIY